MAEAVAVRKTLEEENTCEAAALVASARALAIVSRRATSLTFDAEPRRGAAWGP